MKREIPATRTPDERFMRECFALAEKGKGAVSPNPLVGAVLVRGGKVIARGWHRRFGGPHAEVECLKHAGGNARGATMYVNLEPCSHFGKTPPCADAIIAAGVRRVVVAMRDPNPLVSGGGIRKFRDAGIAVTTSVLEREAKWINRFFLKHIRSGMPYVHMKIAQSIDGYIGGPGAPRWISSPASRRLVHQWRTEYDAVLIGAGTVLADDPRITVRHVPGRHPHVIVLDGRLSLKDSHALMRRTNERFVFLATLDRYAARRRETVRGLEDKGIIVLRFHSTGDRIPLGDVLREVYKYGIGSVLIEGGSGVFAQVRDGDLADEVTVIVSPFMLGGGVPTYATPGQTDARGRDAQTIVRAVGRDVHFHTIFKEG